MRLTVWSSSRQTSHDTMAFYEYWGWLVMNHAMIWHIAAVLVLLFWLYGALEGLRGIRKIPMLSRYQQNLPPAISPHVTVVIAARNEERRIADCLNSLLAQDYPDIDIIVVDDRSDDATGSIAESIAARSGGRLRVLHVTALPAGWLGKCHAMNLGSELAAGDYILFTDADVIFARGALSAAISYAVMERADMLSVSPDVIMNSFWERVMIQAFAQLLTLAYPPWRAVSDKSRSFTGVGAFNLVHREAYLKAGGHLSLRLQVIDDIGLGKLIKHSGGRLRFALGDGLLSLRWLESVSGVIRGLEKNAFACMRYSVFLAIVSLSALMFVSWWPVLGMLAGPPVTRLICAAVYLLLECGIGIAATRLMHNNPFYSFMFPVGSLLIAWTVIRSAWITVRNGGVKWRDTFYDLDDLRRFRL
ncbi:MAG: glycosyltransferase family 2 protein [Candidatus Sumerlaeota bacterium]|nr:glycosyltransferase family 2 protein [Candidatus Sumerlaeota bacterium]